MYRVLYWNDSRELQSFNTLAKSFKESIDLFTIETGLGQESIYSINIIS